MDTNRNQNPNSISSSPTQRDRFELLSAYLDGEVSAAERKQVEDWLATDPATQKLHQRLLMLRQAFQDMPVPAATQSVEKTIDQVMGKVERRANRRKIVWSGAAVAAGLAAAATALFSGGNPAPQMAETQAPVRSAAVEQPVPAGDSQAVMVALDQPLVQIPKTAVAQPYKPKASDAMLRQP
jgi:anti-sigma factor RsiW